MGRLLGLDSRLMARVGKSLLERTLRDVKFYRGRGSGASDENASRRNTARGRI